MKKKSPYMNKKEVKSVFKRMGKIHAIAWKFEKFLQKNWGENYWNELHGHEVMEKIEKYVKKNPAIKIAHCDDDLFASSILVIVPHFKMGHTVYYIPQLTTRKDHFFLYPNHRKSLLEALKTDA